MHQQQLSKNSQRIRTKDASISILDFFTVALYNSNQIALIW